MLAGSIVALPLKVQLKVKALLPKLTFDAELAQNQLPVPPQLTEFKPLWKFHVPEEAVPLCTVAPFAT
jgi:hypothetical protein